MIEETGVVAEVDALEAARRAREEAWSLYKDTEAKLDDRKKKLHGVIQLVDGYDDWRRLKDHPAFKSLLEQAREAVGPGRGMTPQDQGYPNWLAYNDGRRQMLFEIERVVDLRTGEGNKGTLDQWKKAKKELQREIQDLEKLLASSKEAHDKLSTAEPDYAVNEAGE